MNEKNASNNLGHFKDRFSTLLAMVQTIDAVKEIPKVLEFVTKGASSYRAEMLPDPANMGMAKGETVI